MLKIAAWNVTSIRARLDRVLAWLAAQSPDVLCMQELKTEEKTFPLDAFRAAGYEVALACQRTYNGGAVASRLPMAEIARGLDDGVDDTQARLIAATVGGVRLLSCYAPNGQQVGSDKYAYKLRWFDRLRAHLDAHLDPQAPLIVCGDFNVAPEERDVYDPAGWANEPLFHIDARQALERMSAWGLVDTFRMHHAEPGFYSWWDYRMLGFPKNRGLRIDHIFATQPQAARCS